MSQLSQEQAQTLLSNFGDLQTIGVYLGSNGAGGFGSRNSAGLKPSEQIEVDLGEYFIACSRGEISDLTTERLVELFSGAVKTSAMFRNMVEPKILRISQALGLETEVQAALAR